jgi:hypothetical protein
LLARLFLHIPSYINGERRGKPFTWLGSTPWYCSTWSLS